MADREKGPLGDRPIKLKDQNKDISYYHIIITSYYYIIISIIIITS